MRKQILCMMSVFGLAAALATPVLADDLATLAGKWSAKKTTDDGQKVTQELEIKKNKFTFKVMADGETRLYAEGDVKIDKAGPFSTVVFSNIKAGQSSTDSEAIDDTYTAIYKMVDNDTWLVVMNFDKDRDENQKPSLDTYRRAKQAEKTEKAPK